MKTGSPIILISVSVLSPRNFLHVFETGMAEVVFADIPLVTVTFAAHRIHKLQTLGYSARIKVLMKEEPLCLCSIPLKGACANLCQLVIKTLHYI